MVDDQGCPRITGLGFWQIPDLDESYGFLDNYLPAPEYNDEVDDRTGTLSRRSDVYDFATMCIQVSELEPKAEALGYNFVTQSC